MINLKALEESAASFGDASPFPYCVVDNFFDTHIAHTLAKEFPSYDDALWHQYNNAIEVKKTFNVWNQFPPLTYQALNYFNSPEFVALLARLFKIDSLFSDPGLNGGGWHIHKAGGKLNTHLDYSIHPKMYLQRKLNLLVYLNSDWQSAWGGKLGFWSHDAEDAEVHKKALFAPSEGQKNDLEVLELIKKRASVETAASVYKK